MEKNYNGVIVGVIAFSLLALVMFGKSHNYYPAGIERPGVGGSYQEVGY